MKNYILYITSVVLLAGCHLKKKTAEINIIDQKSVLHTTENTKTKTNLKIARTDSSAIVKSSIDNLNYTESIDMEFDLIPSKETSRLSDKHNAKLFENILNKTQKVKIHINRAQHKSNSHMLLQQNNIKSKIDSGVSEERIYKQSQKIYLKENNKLNSETKTYTALTWWIIAIVCILIIVCILRKLNIYTLIAGIFKI